MAGSIKLWERKVILLKAEVTEGTDPVPVVGTNALQVYNFRPTFMDAEQKVRNLEKAYFGADPVAMAAFKRGFSFDMALHGGGAAPGTTVPPWMFPNRFAGFDAGVVTGGISVVQTPLSTPITATGYAYLDDLLLPMIGARASSGFKIEDDEYPWLNFSFLGRAPTTLATQSAPGAPTITGYVDPVLCSSENTTFTLDGYALALRRWEMNSNSDLQYRSLIGPQDVVQMRNRAWRGTVVGRVPDLGTKDYFAKIRPGTTMVGNCVHGTVAGNIVTINAPKLQTTGNVEISEEGGEVMMSVPVTALPTSGNDEITFTTT